MRDLIFFIFAAAASWQDIRYRGVPVYIFTTFALAAFIAAFARNDLPSCVCGALTGAGLLAVPHFTGGAMGMGDSWFFVVSGMLLGPVKNLWLLAVSAFMSGIFSLFVFVFQHIKNGRCAGKDTLPFIPFAAAAGLLLFVGGI